MRSSFGSVRRLPSVKDTPRKKYGRYQARYIGLDGKEYKAPATFPTKQDAEGWLANERKLIDLGQWQPPALRELQAQRDSLTVGEWLDQWLQLRKKDLRVSTWQVYRRTIKNRITGVSDAPGVVALANAPLSALDKRMVVEWWDSINAKFDTATTNHRAYVYLRAAMAEAVDREMLELNPVDLKQARKKAVPKEKDLPTTDELFAVVEQLPVRYRLLGVLCLFMGLRIGEALGLKRCHIENRGTLDSPRWVVMVRGNMQRITDDEGHSVMVWNDSPKTAAGRRDVFIFPRFNSIVENHLAQFAPKAPQELLTTTNEGNVVFDTSFRSRLQEAREAAGVQTRITPHIGRNWLITHLAEKGATPAEIGKVLGQKDLRVITEVYMKVRDDNVQTVLGRVNDSLGGDGGVLSFAEGKARKARRAQGA